MLLDFGWPVCKLSNTSWTEKFQLIKKYFGVVFSSISLLQKYLKKQYENNDVLYIKIVTFSLKKFKNYY